MDVQNLGQVFTPKDICSFMLELKKNKGLVLEPSSGEGAFLNHLDKKTIALEIDKSLIKDKKTLNMDFFDYPLKNQFETIIGNPPYVRFQDIKNSTKKKLDLSFFDKRSNLYLFFIFKCIRHLKKGGELIFITPRDFLKLTSAKNLNELLFSEGSFTDFIELGDKKVFKDFSPNCAIWRWEKGRKSKSLNCGREFFVKKGQILFSKGKNKPLSQFFDVKVGAVSGADRIFYKPKYGNVDMVFSKTYKTGETRKMIYNKNCKSLKPFKRELLSRRIKKFSNKNWWEWGRAFCDREGERIYVNCKTRNKQPFFVSKVQAYDGSVLALFPKDKKMNLKSWAKRLNQMNWNELGFVCDGRFIFSQRSLQHAPLTLE